LQCFYVFVSSFQGYATVSHSLLAIVGFAELTIAVTHCVYRCTTICGSSQKKDGAMVSSYMPVRRA